MRSWILVAVILQLVIIGTETDGKYEFGDIIEFPRKCGKFKIVMYSHYAIYVGPESGVNVSQGDNDIFHRRALIERRHICEFGKLNETRGESIDVKKNYLDNILPAEERTPDKIKERIELKIKECGNYTYLFNNCEHLATYVRYNISRSLQKGRPAQCIFKPIDLARNGFQGSASKTQELMDQSDENNNLSPCEDKPS